MRKILFLALMISLVLGMFLSCNPTIQAVSQPENTIHLNQLGYLPDGYITAAVWLRVGATNSHEFEIDRDAYSVMSTRALHWIQRFKL